MAWTVQERADGSWEIRDGKGGQRGRFADARNLAEHLAMVMEENDKLQYQNGLYRAMRRIDVPTPEDVGRCQRETLEWLVRIAWEHADISTGRAAEILGTDIMTVRGKGWTYRDEASDRK